MRDLDETDLEIVRLLTDDARRPYSEIADHVGLSPPAVSDRVSRLEEIGVIRGFTLDLDRTKIRDGQPILIRLTVKPPAVETVFEQVQTLEETEHLFQLFDGTIVTHVHAPERDVHAWFRSHVDLEAITSYELKPIAAFEWATGVKPSGFDLSCVVCGNAVNSDGEMAAFGGERKAFCCESCLARYEEQYESLQQGAD